MTKSETPSEDQTSLFIWSVALPIELPGGHEYCVAILTL